MAPMRAVPFGNLEIDNVQIESTLFSRRIQIAPGCCFDSAALMKSSSAVIFPTNILRLRRAKATIKAKLMAKLITGNRPGTRGVARTTREQRKFHAITTSECWLPILFLRSKR